ncbi:hypothetical protein OJ253_207 [Cryptosporidium canis]|uniref:Uncharacterized protein n=1 Tax=Cryptosporidium canis TaxID=195482 RepID=A0A9D5DJ66_9CRYT|nr:hypothetical protein OJ253_207 [Cryptosporidium canis]
MNCARDGRLCSSIESKIEVELEAIKGNASNELTISESTFESLVELVCKSFNHINRVQELVGALKLYSGRTFACIQQINVYNGYSEYVRPQLLSILKKSWIISIGICRRISILEDSFVERVGNYCNLDDSRSALDSISYLVLPFLIIRSSNLSSELYLASLRDKLSLLDEIKLGSRFRCLKLVSSISYANRESEVNKGSFSNKAKCEKNDPKLEKEIKQLSTIEQRTCAVLNMLTFSDNKSNGDTIFCVGNYKLVLNLWEEYICMGYRDRLIVEIIETNNLPSDRLKCEILFIITVHIREVSVFEDVVRLIISRTFHDHKIMHYIYGRWKSISANKLECISENLSIEEIEKHREKMGSLIWEFQILMPIISESDSYFIKLQSIALCYFLISEIIQRDEVTCEYKKEVEYMNNVIQILSGDVDSLTCESLLQSFVLERCVYPKIGVFSERAMFSPGSLNLIGHIASVYLDSDMSKAVYYQLVSNMLLDPLIRKRFNLDMAYKDSSGSLVDILDLNRLFSQDNLTKFIYLFGKIPSELISLAVYKFPSQSKVELPFLDTFSPRVVQNSTKYSNSLKFTMEYSNIMEKIYRECKSNIKVALLMLIDLTKKLLNKHISNSKGKKSDQSSYQDDQWDFYYSYLILYKYLCSNFEKYSDYVDQHVVIALNGVTKPELIIPKNITFVY